MASSSQFSVRRGKPQLVSPTEPTPYEFKPLSDIDDQQALRFHVPVIFFYPHNPLITENRADPRLIIKEALSKALVYYYPLAGRIREVGPNGKLTLECTGEGVLYVEADSNIKLEQFGERIQPPFPLDQLLSDVPGFSGVLNCPVLLIQVTRLLCGGFIFAVRLNHAMCDAQGLFEFLNATAEVAHGAKTPSIVPVWERDRFFKARVPPRVTHVHHEYQDDQRHCLKEGSNNDVSLDDVVEKSFYFGPSEISALRSHLPPHLKDSCSSFEVITASLWRCRTVALSPAPTESARLLIAKTGRGNSQCPLAAGYYGNAFAFPGVVTPVEELCKNPLGYAVELIKKTKSAINNIGDYLQSLSDFMTLNNRPPFPLTRTTYIVSDNSRIGWTELNFGWGKPVFAGPAEATSLGDVPGAITFYVRSRNMEGEEGILAPMRLPKLCMERFVRELRGMTYGVIKVWTGGGSLLHLISEVREQSNAVTSLVVLQSGEKLYSGSLDKSIRM
ncbi:hypothetical protein H6P81_006381 [Aristolochia fimbriata]|uniref:Uncharacterized protein n=1 Tax=Aristolochia fimbriata TaxID=158543 RepID=A0AAV7F0M5_ARIFI|nr:hypothetical protein H6P81_006381 [Aristolochia fimbriata]